MIGSQNNAGFHDLMNGPVFVLTSAALDQLLELILADLPWLVGHDLVELGDTADLGVDLVQAKNEPVERAAAQEELLLQSVQEVFAAITRHGHDGQIVVHVLRKNIVLGRAVQLLLATVICVHQEQL